MDEIYLTSEEWAFADGLWFDPKANPETIDLAILERPRDKTPNIMIIVFFATNNLQWCNFQLSKDLKTVLPQQKEPRK